MDGISCLSKKRQKHKYIRNSGSNVVPYVVKMKRVSILLFFVIAFSDLQVVKCSQIVVENGVYSRVTVQIDPQPQPSNCVHFLDKLEVSQKKF